MAVGGACWDVHCNALQACPCSDGTCPSSGQECNIPPNESCADLCKEHGGLAPAGTITPSCSASLCALGGAVPAGLGGFFHIADAGWGQAFNLWLLDGGTGYRQAVVCDAGPPDFVGWCVEDGGRIIIHSELFRLQPDGTLFDANDEIWSPGALCLEQASCSLDAGGRALVACPAPLGWDGG